MEEKIVTLAEFPLIDFVSLVNMVFEDYVIPINWNVLSFKMDARENSISFSDSFVFLRGNEPVGFILIAVRGTRARIDAMGVVPNERGKGLADKILRHAFRHLKMRNIEQVTLEVAAADERAVRFYDKNGFRKLRNLDTFILENPQPLNMTYSALQTDNRLVYSIALSNEINIPRKVNWQREPITLMLSDGRYNLVRFHHSNLEGYLVWGKSDENSSFIVDCAPKSSNPDDWDKLLLISVDYIVRTASPSLISVVAVAEDDLLHAAIERNNFKILLTQYEMVRKL
ncbi:GNAT family N-acetyltransferase [Fervidobacterium islandicum]|uniref:GNAT family N-acetyltransferase n=1 Tax=Fervidobacterium islandicum TaxID=2423 RepID=A0AAI8CL61_FERIS|nr:GNAT family N-acetyltransferase [Fervidobacterium islandicum]AMW32595.1 GNAT family N-acetyltransferase [Fervidobacterium islandicum]